MNFHLTLLSDTFLRKIIQINFMFDFELQRLKLNIILVITY